MRKVLITLAILVVFFLAILAAWIFAGRQVSEFSDRLGTIEIASSRIESVVYEGSGTGGILHVNDLALSLNDRSGPSPTIGTTKDNQLALADRGKVFPFGPPRSESESLAAVPPSGDTAFIQIRRSILSWPTPIEFNFMTGQSPLWKRYLYYQILWTKPNGAKLEMVWRYEQHFYPRNGWANRFMTREGSTGLIRLDIRSEKERPH